jgi:hypothetical protein
MGTRSAIGVMHGDVCKAVYCHWDGYIDHNGKILQNHYDSTKANFLVALGDISSLRPNLVAPEGTEHSFEAPLDDVTVFYGRDRGETGTEWRSFQDYKSFINHFDGSGCEYFYLMKDGVWYVSQYGRPLEVLADVINEENE